MLHLTILDAHVPHIFSNSICIILLIMTFEEQ